MRKWRKWCLKKMPHCIHNFEFPRAYIWFKTRNYFYIDAEIIWRKFKTSKSKKILAFIKRCFGKAKNEKNLFNNLRIRRAPEPSDILWENLQFTKKERKKIGIYSFLFTCLYLLLAFVFLLIFIFFNRRLEVIMSFI